MQNCTLRTEQTNLKGYFSRRRKKKKQFMTHQRKSTTTTSGQVGKARKYGDIDDSDFVHDEIKELGKQIKAELDKFQIRDESSLLDNLRQFGPSEESKAQLRKELEGARHSIQTGTYYVYRNVAPPKINPRTGKPSAASRAEECCRLGPSHRCFCNHTLAEHLAATTSNGGGGGGVSNSRAVVSVSKSGNRLPPCSICGCQCFKYIPNQPEEVGDGFLSRRAGFNAAAWSAKCRCGHGSRSHDPVTKSCRECRGCYGFESNFVCGVCDSHWEDHATIVETEADRRRDNRLVGTDYIPLSEVHPEFREIVFGAETAKALPPGRGGGAANMIGDGRPQQQVQPMSRAQKQHVLMHQQRQVENNNDDEVIEVVRREPPQQQQQQQRVAPVQQQPMSNSNSLSDNNNPQQITCPSCNQINRRLAKFCRACGTKIQ